MKGKISLLGRIWVNGVTPLEIQEMLGLTKIPNHILSLGKKVSLLASLAHSIGNTCRLADFFQVAKSSRLSLLVWNIGFDVSTGVLG